MQEPWRTRWLDYYAVLEVEPGASSDEIRAAFRALARRWHPDAVTQEPEAAREQAGQRFRLLAEAYEVLSDAQRRRDYDVVWKDGGPPAPSSLLLYTGTQRVRTFRGFFSLSSPVDIEGPLRKEPAQLAITCDDPDVELRAVDIDHRKLYEPYPLMATVHGRYLGRTSRSVDLQYYVRDIYAAQRIELDLPLPWLVPLLLFLVPDSRGASPWWRIPEFSAKLGVAWQGIVALLFPIVGRDVWSALRGPGNAFFAIALFGQIALSWLRDDRPPLGMRGMRWIVWAAIGAALYATNILIDSA